MARNDELHRANETLECKVAERTAEVERLLISERDARDSAEKCVQALQVAETAMRDSEKRYRMLSRHLLAAQERERQSLAREIHDQLGQDLVALKMNLRAIARTSRSPAARARLEESAGIVDHAIEKVSTLAFDLRPAALDHLGLFAALLMLVRDHARRVGYRGNLHGAEASVRLPRKPSRRPFVSPRRPSRRPRRQLATPICIPSTN